MRLLDEEKRFLDKRKRFVRSWRYVGSSLILLITALGFWLYFWCPLLANPAYVVAELNRGGIDQKTLELMAILLPVSILFHVFLLLAFIVLSYALFSNERKYLEILTRQEVDFNASLQSQSS